MPLTNRRSGLRLWVPEACLDSMRVEASRHAPSRHASGVESGGLVLGYWASSREAVVTHITTPGPNAIRRATRLLTDVDHDELELQRVWVETEGVSTYLGGWHTHPFSDGGLSWTDRRLLDDITRDPGLMAPQPLMLVVARPAERWIVVAWRGSPVSVGRIRWFRCQRMSVVEY